MNAEPQGAGGTRANAADDDWSVTDGPHDEVLPALGALRLNAVSRITCRSPRRDRGGLQVFRYGLAGSATSALRRACADHLLGRRMTGDKPITGEVLTRISRGMVNIFSDFLGKGPDRCKAYSAGGEAIVVILEGGFSVSERTLFDAGRSDAVQESRFALQQTMAARMTACIEAETGREVIAFMSASHQQPDYNGEIFILGPPRPSGSPPGDD